MWNWASKPVTWPYPALKLSLQAPFSSGVCGAVWSCVVWGMLHADHCCHDLSWQTSPGMSHVNRLRGQRSNEASSREGGCALCPTSQQRGVSTLGMPLQDTDKAAAQMEATRAHLPPFWSGGGVSRWQGYRWLLNPEIPDVSKDNDGKCHSAPR